MIGFDERRSLWERMAELPRRWFVEREIILRSEGRTRYFRIAPWMQLTAVSAWIVAAGWISFTSMSYWQYSEIVETRTLALDEARDSYRSLLNQVAEYQLSVMAITRDLEAKQQNLRGLLDQNEVLRHDLKQTESQLKAAEAERQRSAQYRKAIGEKLGELEATVRNMWGENGALERHINQLRTQLVAVEAEREEIAQQRSHLSRRMAQIQTDLRTSQTRVHELEGTLDSLRRELTQVASHRDRAHEEAGMMKVRVRDLESRIDGLHTIHREVLHKLTDRTRGELADMQKIISRTGLNLDALAPGRSPQRRSWLSGGQGGPLVPLLREQGDPYGIDTMTAALNLHLERLDRVQSVIRSIPLLPPLDGYSLMSGFGPRLDPFTGQPAMHYGLDMSAPLRTPVMATAPGEVSVAGWRSRYGRMVEIDHGHGLSTRYGHLHRINVRRGQRVEFREVIGLLGSTGRSTGPHVHYEVLVNGQPTDPAKFLRAGRDVFKG